MADNTVIVLTADNVVYTQIRDTDNYSIDSIKPETILTAQLSEITDLTVPEKLVFADGSEGKVTSLSATLLAECSSLTKLTLPFVGRYINANRDSGPNYKFCAIFGSPADPKNIPESLKDVVISGDCAVSYQCFNSCQNLQTITFNGKVYENIISSNAFSFCFSLSSIKLPNDIIKIESSAFYHCRNLQQLKLPDTVSNIEGQAFRGCTNLQTIYLPQALTKLSDRSIFEQCTSLTNLYINCDVITSIAQDMFSSMNIQNIYFKKVDYWNELTFSTYKTNPMWAGVQCYIYNSETSEYDELVEYTFPEDLKQISSYCFYGFKNLEKITLPKACVEIGNEAFKNCDSLSNVYYPKSSEDYNNISFTDMYSNPLAGSINAETLDGSGAELYVKLDIEDENYTLLETLDLSAIKDVNQYAFTGCSSIKELNIGNSSSLQTIGRYAFYNCKNLAIHNIILNAEIQQIGINAFRNCDESSLDAESSGGYYIKINENPFGCFYKAISEYITEISINNNSLNPNTQMIVGGALAKLPNLVNINLRGSNVEYIGDMAFAECPELAEITLNKKLKQSGTKILYKSSKCKLIYLIADDEQGRLGDGLRAWLNFALDASGNLSCSFNSASASSIKINYAIKLKTDDNDSVLTSKYSIIKLPEDITVIKKEAFSAFDWMETIYIPATIKEIQSGAFVGLYPKAFSDKYFSNICIESLDAYMNITMPRSEACPNSEGDLCYYRASPYYPYSPNDSLDCWANPFWRGIHTVCNGDGCGTEIGHSARLYQCSRDTVEETIDNDSQLEILKFSDSIEYIPAARFVNCQSIKEVIFSPNLKAIGMYAFMNSLQVKKVRFKKFLADKVTVGSKAFACIRDHSVYFDGTLSDYLKKFLFRWYIPNRYTHAYGLLTNARHLYLGNCEELINDDYINYSLITDLQIPEAEDLDTIQAFAFHGYDHFASVHIGDNITQIEQGAFEKSDFPALYISGKFFDPAFADIYNIVTTNSLRDEQITAFSNNQNKVEVHIDTSYSQDPDTLQATLQANALRTLHRSNAYFMPIDETYLLNIQNFIFFNNNDICSVIKYVGEDENIVFPDFSGRSSYDIENDAMRDLRTIQSINFNQNVCSIESNAFYQCTKLSNIILDEIITRIDSYAFAGCSDLTHIDIPGSIKEVAEGVFAYCDNLQTVVVSHGIEKINDKAFSSTSNEIFNIYLPASLKSITGAPFQRVDNVYYAGSIAQWCNNTIFEKRASNPLAVGSRCTHFYLKDSSNQYNEIRKLILPPNVEFLDDYRFYNCQNFTEIEVQGSLRYVTEEAFSSSVKFSQVYINDIKSWCSTYFPTPASNILYGAELYVKNEGEYKICNDLKLPTYATEIKSNVFAGCTSIKTVTLPPYIEFIGNAALSCPNLETIKFNGTIENWLKIKLPYNVISTTTKVVFLDKTTPDNYVEFTTLDLTNIDITHIWQGAFYNWINLETITLPKTLTELDAKSFYNCSNLKSVTFRGTALKEIKDQTFYNCKALEGLSIPGGVEHLGSHIFGIDGSNNTIQSSKKFLNLHIPTSLVSIENKLDVECVQNLYIDSLKHYCELAQYGARSYSSLYDAPYIGFQEEIGSYTRYNDYGPQISLHIKQADGNDVKIENLVIDDTLDIEKIGSGSIKFEQLKTIDIKADLKGKWSSTICTGWLTTNTESITLPDSIKLGYDSETNTVYEFALSVNNNLSRESSVVGADGDVTHVPGVLKAENGFLYIKSHNNPYFCLYSWDKEWDGVTNRRSIHPSTAIINAGACTGCEDLSELSIPESVIYIGAGAFNSCINLEHVYLPDEPHKDFYIHETAFGNYSSYRDEFIPLCHQADAKLITNNYKNGCYLGSINNLYRYFLALDKDSIIKDSSIKVGDKVEVIPKNTVYVHNDVQQIARQAFNCYRPGSQTVADHLFLATTIIYEGEHLNIKQMSTDIYPCSHKQDSKDPRINIVVKNPIEYFKIPAVSHTSAGYATQYSLYEVNSDNQEDCITLDNCHELSEIRIPEDVTALPATVQGFDNITVLYLPSTLKYMNCYGIMYQDDNIKLKNIYYNNTISTWINNVKYVNGYSSSFWTKFALLVKVDAQSEDYIPLTMLDELVINPAHGLQKHFLDFFKFSGVIRIGDNIKEIPAGAFANCTFSKLIFDEGVKEIHPFAFEHCTVTDIEFPKSLDKIHTQAFTRCSAIRHISIPGSTYIDTTAFGYDAQNIEVLELSSDVRYIGQRAFQNSKLSKVIIPENCEYVGEQAFGSGVENIQINSRTAIIHYNAFLKSANMISSIDVRHDTLIYDALWGAYNAKILYKDSPEYFSQGLEFNAINDEEEAFEIIGIGSCVDTYLLIPSKYRQRPVISIKDSAFANNTKIKGFKISSKNINIEANAFKNCSNLDYVNCNKLDPCGLDATALSGCDLADLRIEVPKNALDTYKAADGWKDFAHCITSNYYILSVEKDLNYRIGNIGASLRAKTGYKGSYTFAEMSKRISDIETYFVDASDEDIIPENIKYEVDINGVIGTFSSDATASADDILENTVAYSKGEKLIGTILRNDVSDISTDGAVLDIPKGYYENTNIELKSLVDGELSAPTIEISDDKIYASVTVAKDGFIDSTDISQGVYDLNQHKVAISTPQISVSEDGQVTAAVDQSVSGWVTKDTTSQATFDLSESWVKKEELVSLSFRNPKSFQCYASYIPADQSLTSQIATIDIGATKVITVPKHSTVIVYTTGEGIRLEGGPVSTVTGNPPNVVFIGQAPDTDTEYTIWGTE